MMPSGCAFSNECCFRSEVEAGGKAAMLTNPSPPKNPRSCARLLLSYLPLVVGNSTRESTIVAKMRPINS